MTSLEAAKYIIALLDSKGDDSLTNKKLQKLLYYVQAWNLAVFSTPLFDEEPQAWRHGPVYPSVYHVYKKFGSEKVSIDDEYERTTLSSDETVQLIEREQCLPVEQLGLIEEIIKKYATRSALHLEIISHQEKPWLDAREGLGDFDASNNVITHDSMRQYYSSLRKKKELA